MSAPRWKLDGVTARTEEPFLAAAVNVRQPHAGIADVQISERPIEAARLLAFDSAEAQRSGVTLGADVEDAYVRGADLVVTYREQPNFPLRYQIYWRVLVGEARGEALAGIEVIVSAQTSVLDMQPDGALASRLAAEGGVKVGGACLGIEPLSREGAGEATDSDAFLFRISNPGYAYAELVHPDDRADTLAFRDEAGIAHTRFDLFAHRLEKGVILRARARALILPAADASGALLACRRQFAQSPPPLTT